MRKITVEEKPYPKELDDRKGHISIDWGRQGGTILAYIIVLLGYYGIIANTVMFNKYGKWIPFTLMGDSILCLEYGLCSGEWLFWTYTTYAKNFYLPALLLFLICFALTYKEDIPHYGIKASIWLVPLIIIEGFIFYTLMFGFSAVPFYLKFMRIEGYLDIMLLFGLAISGAISGMKLKQVIVKRRNI